jgi:pimeloyl-ACP methyl ester carboxylesterase
MPVYREDRHEINGVDTAVFTAGGGPPLVFFHGGGTATGFDCLLPLAERFLLVVPHHPGFGASADDPLADSVQDYVVHNLELFDRLGLDEISLAGHSLGGLAAALLALQHPRRIRRLVLAAPIGLHVPEHPAVDLLSVAEEDVPGYLAADMSVFAGLPNPPTAEFLAERRREAQTLARVRSGGMHDPKLARWLHRVASPTLVLWGAADRLVPVEQAAAWADALPNAETKVLPGVGHLLFDESREAVDAVGDFVAAG